MKEEHLSKAFELYPVDFKQENGVLRLQISPGRLCEGRIRGG